MDTEPKALAHRWRAFAVLVITGGFLTRYLGWECISLLWRKASPAGAGGADRLLDHEVIPGAADGLEESMTGGPR